MSERQIHGFNYEHMILNKFNIQKSSDYTSIWDGYKNDIPVSIKTAKLGSDIEMADFFRNAACTKDFILIVGFWAETKSNIVEEYILYIVGLEWHALFPDGFENKFKILLKNITNDYKDDKKWKKQIAILRKEWQENSSNLIRPRFKRDHKTQKRIQCAINNRDFYNYFIPKYSKGDTIGTRD